MRTLRQQSTDSFEIDRLNYEPSLPRQHHRGRFQGYYIYLPAQQHCFFYFFPAYLLVLLIRLPNLKKMYLR